MNIQTRGELARSTRFSLLPLLEVIRGKISPETDWASAIGAANEQLVSPRLYLELQGRSGKANSEAIEYLLEVQRANCDRNNRIVAQMSEIAGALNSVGIVPVALKGAAYLVRRNDAKNRARMLLDIDFLIGENQLPTALPMLRERGYREVEGSEYAHSPGSFWRENDPATLDLQIGLPNRADSIISLQELLVACQILDIGGAKVRVPDATRHFAFNLAHDMLHDHGSQSGFVELRYLWELMDLSEDEHDQLDLAWLREKCSNPAFSLALELQDRMAELFFGRRILDTARSARGAFLHQRRKLKLHFAGIGRVEWEFVRRVRALV